MALTRHIVLKCVIIILIVACCAPSVQGIIYPKSSAPNGYLFYPLPKDTVGVSMWLADVYKYYEAKNLRTDSIKASLTADMGWGVDKMLALQVPGFGFLPSTTQAPQLKTILSESYDIFGYVSNFKSLVKRVRPCRRFREDTFGVEPAGASDFQPGNSSEFSFPSSHAGTSDRIPHHPESGAWPPAYRIPSAQVHESASAYRPSSSFQIQCPNWFSSSAASVDRSRSGSIGLLR